MASVTDSPTATAPEPAGRPGSRDRSYEQVLGNGVQWLARWSLRWLLIAAGVWVLLHLVGLLWSIVLPVMLALVLATVLEPPARWLERRLHLPGTLAAILVVLLGFVVLLTLVALLAPSVTDQAIELSTSVSSGLDQLQQTVYDAGLGITQEQVDQAVKSIQDRLGQSSSQIASGVLVGVGAVGSALVTTALTVVLAFLFVKDGRRFLPWLEGLVGPRAGSHLGEVGRRAWATLGGFVRTQALVGLIDAVLIGLGLLVLGVPLVVPLAVITFFAAFVPVVGAFVAGGIAVMVALVDSGWVTALVVLAIVLVVQQVEGNLLLPWLQGKSLQLHAGVVLLTITLGSTLYGVAGAFLGVPVVAVVGTVARYVLEQVRFATGDGPPPDDDETQDETQDETHDRASDGADGADGADEPDPLDV